MPERILIWGAGAIGGIVGALLARAGHDVTLVDANAEHVAAIRAGGLAIEGPIESFVAASAAFLPEGLSGSWPCILLAVKAQHTEAACRALAPHLDEGGYVVSLQNGLCWPAIGKVVGEARCIGAIVHIAGDWLAPGRIRYGMRGSLLLGEIDGRVTPRLEALCALLSAAETGAEITTALGAMVWSKLCFTALMIAQATGEAGIADCLARPELLPLWRRLVGEVAAVAAAEGVTPLALDGLDPAAFGRAGSDAAARHSIDTVVAHTRAGAKTHSGFWRDIAVRRRRTEADAQLRPVLDLGRAHGIDCPVLRRLAATIAEIEDGRRPQADGNLLELAAR
ncbi:MAG: 2-dehydropantoate 2-reductase [Rhodospirillaceae bacterium]|nr:2-dehydropantoate 2-reductase [Rhodospirillaceae bacterium]